MNFEEYLELSKLQPNTIQTYTRYSREVPLNPTQEDINKLLILHNHPVYRSFLRKYMQFIGRKDIDIIKISGTAGKPKTETPTFLEEQQIRTILRSAKTLKMRIIIRLLFETGLRVSELCNLQKKNIDLDNKKVIGRGKRNKPFNQPYYTDSLNNALKKYLNRFSNEDYPFQWPNLQYQRDKVRYELNKLGKSVYGQKVNPHQLRHSLAQYLVDNGMNIEEVKEILRHEKLETVMIYTKVRKDQLYKKAKKLFE